LIKLEGQNNYIEQQHQTEDIIAADSTAESNSNTAVCENRKHGMYDMNNEIAINDSNTVETDILASSTSQTRGKRFDLIDHVINDARKIIELKDLCSKLSYSQPIGNFIPLQPNFNVFPSDTDVKNIQLPFGIESRLPFGFRVLTCGRCLESRIMPVLYPITKEETNEVVHKCRPESIAAFGHSVDKLQHMLRLRDFSLRSLPLIIAGFPLNRYDYLVAVPLSNPPDEILLLPNPQKPHVPMSLFYSQEAQAELNLDRQNQSDNNILFHHWAARAIMHGPTRVTQKEIVEFLQLIGGTASFAFFKVTINGSFGYYFMVLSNIVHANGFQKLRLCRATT
jgi:hypothetical protein